jgi:uncharacterized protein (TIGR04168 family)
MAFYKKRPHLPILNKETCSGKETAMVNSVQPGQPASIKIAVVGDVHDRWDENDEIALKHLGIDLVLFVGDFGNEAVGVVRAIAQLNLPKAVIFGNHDGWYSITERGRKKCPYDRQVEDRLQTQIDLFADVHVGYGKLDFPEFDLTVVGARPFSWGGSKWKHGEFYSHRYGVNSFEESTACMVDAVKTAAHDTVIFIGHCGPKGLGDAAEDPCGKDWKPIGGDHGDPDFAAAIAQSQSLGKSIPLVAFGHMHHQLRHTKHQLRKRLDQRRGTVYLNAASVPRIVQTELGWQRNFSVVTMDKGVVTEAALVWVDQAWAIASQEILYQQPQAVPA